jgi:hypothetical protein
MIIDPQSFVTLETSRRLAEARAAQAARSPALDLRRRPGRRGVVLRLAAWATGRAVHA